MPPTDTLVPEYRVLVNGSALPSAAAADTLSVSVHLDVAAPGMFEVRLASWDMSNLRITWIDDALFDLGKPVAVQMGYVNKLVTLLSGEITGLEPEFSADERPVVVVRGYDKRHRLLRGRKTRTFVKMKDSAIAQKIAGEAGLPVDVVDSKVELPYVMQHSQTDMEFLQERAHRIGYEVAFEKDKLQFRPQQNAQAEAVTLKYPDDLLEFYPRMSAVGLPGGVQVLGWDPAQKKALAGKATSSQVNATMGGSKVGLAAADTAFGAASAVRVSSPPSSQAEADAMAQGEVNRRALGFITGQGQCVGRADIAAGIVVKMTGLGRRFSGLYYVVSATHSYTAERGYRTSFTVKRNAT